MTDVEVLQEILHRFVALQRRDAIRPVRAEKKLSARDALHVAVVERQGVRRVLSFDAGFDHVPGLARLR